MNKRVTFKLLVPLLMVVIIAVAISMFIVTKSISEQIYTDTDELVETEVKSAIKQINLSNNLVIQQVKQGVNILIDQLSDLGEPSLGNEINVNGKSANDLLFGKYKTGNDFSIVDHVKSIAGGTATIFARRNNEFIRISTNVQKSDGTRAIGTILNPDGKAYKNILRGEAYYGLVNILGNPYITAYVPIFNSSKDVVGIYYAGYMLTTLSEIGETISESQILENGFIALLDEKEQVVFHSKTTDDDKVTQVLKENTWNKVIHTFDQWGYKVIGAYPGSDVEKIVSGQRNSILQGGIFLLLLMGITLYLLTRFIVTKPLKELETSSIKYAAGEFDEKVNVTSEDEFGSLARSFESMIGNLKNSFNEVSHKSQEAEVAAERGKVAETNAVNQQKYLEEKTVEILKEMEKFAEGDLTVRVNETGNNDDIDKLFKGFNGAVEKISTMMTEVTTVVNQTAVSGNQISSSTEEMAAGAQEQSSQIGEVAGAVEEITKTLIETSQSISKASELAKEAGTQASNGEKVITGTVNIITEIADVVKNAAENVQELGESTRQISEIIQVINDIADQTNLLALNAAIEAARAGEEGRGFAVVADEVRKLAERTGKATKEIETMISGIQNKTDGVINSIIAGTSKAETGKNSASAAGEALRAIVTSSQKVDDMIVQIASASEQQSSSIEEISKSVEMINSVSQQSAEGVNQIARSAEDLYRLTNDLQGMIEQFKIKRLSREERNLLN